MFVYCVLCPVQQFWQTRHVSCETNANSHTVERGDSYKLKANNIYSDGMYLNHFWCIFHKPTIALSWLCRNVCACRATRYSLSLLCNKLHTISLSHTHTFTRMNTFCKTM